MSRPQKVAQRDAALQSTLDIARAELESMKVEWLKFRVALELIRESCDTWRMTLPRAAEGHRTEITKIVTDALGET